MHIPAALRLIAGIVVLISLALTQFHDPRWIWLTVFVALNLIQSSFSGWCPAVWMLKKAGVPD